VAEILRMPEVAANTPEAVLSSWNVALNTPYGIGAAIATVETEKANVDVEAEVDGMLLRLLAEEGETVSVGTPIAIWGGSGDSAEDVDALVATLGRTEDAPAGRSAGAASSEGSDDVVPPGRRIFASPLARRLAREAGLDLTVVAGNGPNHRVRRRDVEAAIAQKTRPAPSAPAQDTAQDVPVAPSSAFEDVPLSRMRQAIARRLVDSSQNAPHFYLRGTARVDRLLDLRRELNAGDALTVSLNDLVVKAVAAAHSRVPGLNVQWNRDSIRHFKQVDISVAVATEHGLVTPVVRGVDTMGVRHLAGRTRDLVTRAHARTLRQSDLEGGAITVTNLGMFGTEEFAAIINPPQAAILAVGAASEQPVVADGEVAVATLMRLCLAVDHRPVDGATAAEWMGALVEILEHPLQILA
jgi:pyruvate dehydrogenase E2 component (dihydrolipoamide acetyltransferase)